MGCTKWVGAPELSCNLCGWVQRDKVMGELHMNMRVEHEASLNFVAAFFEEVPT